MSLKESMKRLAYMCERCNEEGTEEYDVKDIVKSGAYAFDFNHDTLHSVETNIFKPWLTSALSSSPSSIHSVLSECWSRKSAINSHASTCKSLLSSLSKNRSVPSSLLALQKTCTTIASLIDSNIHDQDTVLVPSINAAATSSQQKRLNSRILKSLGITQARTHLSSMWEVVRHEPEEVELWKIKIPKVARIIAGSKSWEDKIGRMKEITPNSL
eukprot:CAMPEP_0182497680 /NCGR_PEP_ID=MMETSP1321-20130603/6094_1 /TAXON_ID=91990 /ORGANISM="Bolidomonas sp., Strain RCC1657" /LENGTH=213 /DNA_ID=CAMNT_0024701609 /DNA_START=439 /DNA_END=1080 /DNA_ORIENTATION=-